MNATATESFSEFSESQQSFNSESSGQVSFQSTEDPIDCGENAVFTCGCFDIRCNHPEDDNIRCFTCNNKCFCDKGFCRNVDGKCVRKNRC